MNKEKNTKAILRKMTKQAQEDGLYDMQYEDYDKFFKEARKNKKEFID